LPPDSVIIMKFVDLNVRRISHAVYQAIFLHEIELMNPEGGNQSVN